MLHVKRYIVMRAHDFRFKSLTMYFFLLFSLNLEANSLEGTQASLIKSNVKTPNIALPCAIELNDKLSLSPNAIIFYEKSSSTIDSVAYEIVGEKVLLSFEVLSLSVKQTQAVIAFESNIRRIVPKAGLIINESFVAAQQSVKDIFSPLLSEKSDPVRNIHHELSLLKNKFNEYFTPTNTIIIDSKGHFIDTIIGQKVEQYIASLTQQLIADLSLALMSNMLFSNESFSDIQMKIKTATQDLKAAMRHHKYVLNTKATDLCVALNAINESEELMKNIIPELSHFDIFLATK